MEFFEDGDDIVSLWQPTPNFQGWLNTLHGGIQSVLLDEICGWVVMRKLQTAGVIGAILVGLLLFFFALLFASSACLIKCLADCRD